MVGCTPGVAISVGSVRPTARSRSPCLENAGTELEQNLAGTTTFALLGGVHFSVLFSSGWVAHGVLQSGGLARNRLAARCGFGRLGTNRRSLGTLYSERR